MVGLVVGLGLVVVGLHAGRVGWWGRGGDIATPRDGVREEGSMLLAVESLAVLSLFQSVV